MNERHTEIKFVQFTKFQDCTTITRWSHYTLAHCSTITVLHIFFRYVQLHYIYIAICYLNLQTLRDDRSHTTDLELLNLFSMTTTFKWSKHTVHIKKLFNTVTIFSYMLLTLTTAIFFISIYQEELTENNSINCQKNGFIFR